MKHITNILKMAAVGVTLTATSCSDYADYNSVPASSDEHADNTLYQNILQNEQLSDFAKILQKTGYDKTLDAANSYTVWAPINGSYDAESILAMDSANIALQFLNHHIAQYSYQTTTAAASEGGLLKIVSLNDKKHSFTATQYDGKEIMTKNQPSSNGIMHLISGKSPFYYNVYEKIEQMTDCDSLKAYVKNYDETYLDTKNSVVGPLVNGKQTYLDSVFKTRNNIIERIMNAKLSDEDSVYTMLCLNDEAWRKTLQKVKPLYRYVPSTYYIDLNNTGTTAGSSISTSTAKSSTAITTDTLLYNDSLPKRMIVRNMVYSKYNAANQPLWTNTVATGDTLVSTNGTQVEPQYIQNIFNNTVKIDTLSNGMMRTLNDFCLAPTNYNPVLSTRTPSRILKMKDDALYTTETIQRKDLDETLFEGIPTELRKYLLPDNETSFTYVYADPNYFSSNMSQVEWDFKIQNLRSTKYHMYIVFLPVTIDPETAYEVKEAGYKVTLYYTDASGNPAKKNINTKYVISRANAGKVAVLQTEFDFPTCIAGLKDAYATLTIENANKFSTASMRNKYEQSIRLGGIYLIPDEIYQLEVNQ